MFSVVATDRPTKARGSRVARALSPQKPYSRALAAAFHRPMHLDYDYHGIVRDV
jgi:hypothetical protein